MILGEETLSMDSFRTAHSSIISIALNITVSSCIMNPKSRRQETDAQASTEHAKLNSKELFELRFLLDQVNKVMKDLEQTSQRDFLIIAQNTKKVEKRHKRVLNIVYTGENIIAESN